MAEPSGEFETPAILGGKPVRPEGPPSWPINDAAVRESLESCFADGSWGRYHGRNCDALTGALRAMHGCEHAVLCSSGTAAVELALRGLKVGPGDEVILSAYDFKANFTNVLTVGATPVLVDVRPENWQLDVEQLQSAISDKTQAILVSHLHGGVVDMPAVRDIARRSNLPVIEDACQMPGAMIYGHVAGRWGDIGVHSFGGSKLLTAGRGGALTIHDAEIAQRIRLYTQRGNEAYPLSELQAAVLLPQLEVLEERNRKRTENVAKLSSLLSDTEGLSVFHNTDPRDFPKSLGSTDAETTPGYYKLGLQYDRTAFGGLTRDDFACAMQAEGIALNPGFRALHCIHSKRRFRAVGKLPNAGVADAGILTLHHPVLLEDDPAIAQIATAVDKIRTAALNGSFAAVQSSLRKDDS